MTTVIFLLLNFLDRITAAVRRRFTREPCLSQEYVDAKIASMVDGVADHVAQRFNEALAAERADLQEKMTEYVAATARLDAETEALRVLVNLGLAKVHTRAELYRSRN
jgi:hypothetical protein